MAPVVGFAFWELAVTPVGKRVFLFVVATTPNAMLCMTTTAGMVQKAAVARSKSPPLAVKKQQLVGPSLTLPKEGTEKVPFFYDQNGKCLRFVTSLSANRLNKAKIDR